MVPAHLHVAEEGGTCRFACASAPERLRPADREQWPTLFERDG
jgi:hypothetical protein